MSSLSDEIQVIRNAPDYLGKQNIELIHYKWSQSDTLERTLISTDDEKPVHLSCITRITPQNYWLTSCGMWHGHTEINPTFTSVKPSCTGRRPDEKEIGEDFTNVITNIRKLTNILQLKERTPHKGLLTDWTTPDPKIRFRHVLFTLTSADDEDNDNGANNLGVEFSLEQWPAHFEEARNAILDLQLTNTHKLNILPAYDINGKIIKPKEYRSKIEGALVRTEFTMHHWQVKKHNYFAANIEAMRVLQKPRASTLKRKTLSAIDPGPSTTKKKKEM